MDATEKETMIGKSWLNGSLQYVPNPDGTGEAVGYYKDGALWFRSPILNGEVHGIVQVWYPDGALAEEIHYRNGVSHGWARHWYRDGVMEEESQFNKGQLH